jgi:hypothetical protein
MKYLLIVLSLILSTPVFADTEVSIGYSYFNIQPDGTWYQNPFQHTLRTSSPSFSIGWTGYATDKLRWRTGYAYLGNVQSDAMAVGDATYAQWGAQGNQHGPMYHLVGSGDVQEIYATLDPEYKTGKLTLFVEGGLALYRPTWYVAVCPVGQDCGHSVGSVHDPRWEITPILGMGIGYNKTSFVYSVQRVNAAGDDLPALYKGIVNTFSIRQAF